MKKEFPVRLTKWFQTEKRARKFADNFFKRSTDKEGQTHVILRRKNYINSWAVFKEKESQYRDKDYEVKIPLYDFLIKNISRKREGVSILKTTSISF